MNVWNGNKYSAEFFLMKLSESEIIKIGYNMLHQVHILPWSSATYFQKKAVLSVHLYQALRVFIYRTFIYLFCKTFVNNTLVFC